MIKLVHVFCDGDIDVKLYQSTKGGRLFRVVYGEEIKERLTYEEASKKFGECVFHSLACAGRLFND